MDLDDKLIIKVQLNDEIRKMPIHNEEITYDELIIMMERVFKHKLNPNDEITIKYKDEDGDLITISDDSDLIFAIETSKVLKLVLTVQNEEIETDKNEKQLSSLDLKTIRKELQHIRDCTIRLLDKTVQLNGDHTTNTNASGRNSTIGVGDYHGVGGKEFDPLSVGNQTNFHVVERTGSAASIGSNIRQEDMKFKIDVNKQSHSQDRRLESVDIQRPSLTKSQNIPTSMTSSTPVSNIVQSVHPSNVQSHGSSGAFNVPPSTVGSGQNYQPQNAGNTNMPPQIMNMPPSSSPIGMSNIPGQQHLPPSNMANQNLPLSNMVHQNLPPSNVSHQNLPPSNMANQNLPPSNMMHQNMPPSGMSGQHMPPSNLSGQHLPQSSFNPVSQHNEGPGKMPGYIGQPMQSPVNVQRPAFYPPGTMPGQNRPNMPNYNAPNTGNNMMANGPQLRGNMQPLGPSYFNPQTTMQQGGQMFNPQMQQPPQNSNYGYQQNK